LSLASFPGLTRESSSLLVERSGPAGLDPRIKSGGDDGGGVRRVTSRVSGGDDGGVVGGDGRNGMTVVL
ncbi:hypothetical protein, partial [Iodidimonas gelatinilytica]|uniref:hypothetical protein n=1 Tax=Iodidimonas gelatinilytica TaxID=1236966 RepID=UPI001B2FFD9C